MPETRKQVGDEMLSELIGALWDVDSQFSCSQADTDATRDAIAEWERRWDAAVDA